MGSYTEVLIIIFFAIVGWELGCYVGGRYKK